MSDKYLQNNVNLAHSRSIIASNQVIIDGQ